MSFIKKCPSCSSEVVSADPYCWKCHHDFNKPGKPGLEGAHWAAIISGGGLFIALTGGLIMFIVSIVSAPTPRLTAEERLQRDIDQGQREVCRKWGDGVEGC